MVDPILSLSAAAFVGLAIWVLFRSEKGLLARWRQTRQMTERVSSEDALKYVHKCEMRGQQPTLESIAGVLQLTTNDAAQLLGRIQDNGLLRIGEGGMSLTPVGRETALHIIRAHRLWERYLSDQTGYREVDWHAHAERQEHLLTGEDVEALSAQLGFPTHDPHGDPIPTASGRLVPHEGVPLTSLEVDTQAQIVHLEDEPEIVFAQLTAEGLHPGMLIRVTESTPHRVRFWANGDEHLLAPIVASNISVRAFPEMTTVQREAYEPLSSLDVDETAEVIGLSPYCRGIQRRRLMDLGILPGTVVTAEMRSPGGDPTAYRVRGALIALRNEQAGLINVKRHRTIGDAS